MAGVVLEVAREYDFERKLHCFVGDNATSNDNQFIEGLNESPHINFGSENRIRCAGHIINLVVKATIYGSGISKFEEELSQAAPMDQFQLFRRYGVVGKLHNFVNAVCASHRRRELFLATQKDIMDEDSLFEQCTLQLRQDGGVRWHSVYLMMLRCLELREPIKRFIRRLRAESSEDRSEANYDPLTDGLTEDEWDEVSELVNFLQAPFEMTRRLEGSNSVSGFGSLWQTLVNLQVLWRHYRSSYDYGSSPYFQSAVSFGLEKLNTYFERLVLDPTPSFYAIATALHPGLRLVWFKGAWKDFPSWHSKAEKSVRTAFKQYVDAEVDQEVLEEPISQPSVRLRQPGKSNRSSLYEDTIAVDLHLLTGSKSHKRQKRVSQLDEYFNDIQTDFMSASPAYRQLLNDPWRWWLEDGRNRYPIVFKMAIDYLSIPSTSCECERVFSSARRTITCDRNNLSGSLIEALQLQKSWLRRGVVDSGLIKLQCHIENLQNACAD